MGVNDILQVGTTVISVSAAFIYLAPELAMLSCLPIPIIPVGVDPRQKRIAPRYASVRVESLLGECTALQQPQWYGNHQVIHCRGPCL